MYFCRTYLDLRNLILQDHLEKDGVKSFLFLSHWLQIIYETCSKINLSLTWIPHYFLHLIFVFRAPLNLKSLTLASLTFHIFNHDVHYISEMFMSFLFCLSVGGNSFECGVTFWTGRGFIELKEFQDLVRCKIQEDEDEKELRQIFHVLDKEKRGEVSCPC